jgi:Uri superfamily endonuclease
MKGVYVLIISMAKNVTLDFGSLGKLDFPKGLYAYVGSAQNGLEKRVERHLGSAKRQFWHIDYLLGNDAAKVLKVFCKEAGKVEECRISDKIDERGIPIRGFGSSDCKCKSHLFKIEDYGFLREMHEITVKPPWEVI